MKVDDPRTIATMAHGRTTVQAWWVEGVVKYRTLAWAVDGREVDTGGDRLREAAAAGDQDAATLIGLFAMTGIEGGGHVKLPWQLTDHGKKMAGECPCGPCSWEDPPVRQKRKASEPKIVNAKERRKIRRERQRRIDAAVAEQLEAQARRIRELELDLATQRQHRQARVVRLLAEARAEAYARGRAEAEREAAKREKLREAGRRGAAAVAGKVARGASGRFVKKGAEK